MAKNKPGSFWDAVPKRTHLKEAIGTGKTIYRTAKKAYNEPTPGQRMVAKAKTTLPYAMYKTQRGGKHSKLEKSKVGKGYRLVRGKISATKPVKIYQSGREYQRSMISTPKGQPTRLSIEPFISWHHSGDSYIINWMDSRGKTGFRKFKNPSHANEFYAYRAKAHPNWKRISGA